MTSPAMRIPPPKFATVPLALAMAAMESAVFSISSLRRNDSLTAAPKPTARAPVKAIVALAPTSNTFPPMESNALLNDPAHDWVLLIIDDIQPSVLLFRSAMLAAGALRPP